MKNYLFSHGHFCGVLCSVCMFHRHLMNLPSQCSSEIRWCSYPCVLGILKHKNCIKGGNFRCPAWCPALWPIPLKRGCSTGGASLVLSCSASFHFTFKAQLSSVGIIIYFLFPLPFCHSFSAHSFGQYGRSPKNANSALYLSRILEYPEPIL